MNASCATVLRKGITADLEAMKRVGIGGVLIMEVDQGAPVGPVDFMSADWQDLFQHVHREAQRLGLQVNEPLSTLLQDASHTPHNG